LTGPSYNSAFSKTSISHENFLPQQNLFFSFLLFSFHFFGFLFFFTAEKSRESGWMEVGSQSIIALGVIAGARNLMVPICNAPTRLVGAEEEEGL
jgi:hypothetical protein